MPKVPESWDDGLPPAPRGASRFRRWYLISIALILVGSCLGPLLMVKKTLWLATPSGDTTFQAPGEMVLKLDAPGDYLVWFEKRGLIGGVLHNDTRTFSRQDFTTQVTDLASGAEVGVKNSLKASVSMLIVERTSIGSFSVDHAGEYRVRVSTADPAPARVSVDAAPTGRLASLLAVSVIVTILGSLAALGGVLLFLITLVRHLVSALRGSTTLASAR